MLVIPLHSFRSSLTTSCPANPRILLWPGVSGAKGPECLFEERAQSCQVPVLSNVSFVTLLRRSFMLGLFSVYYRLSIRMMLAATHWGGESQLLQLKHWPRHASSASNDMRFMRDSSRQLFFYNYRNSNRLNVHERIQLQMKKRNEATLGINPVDFQVGFSDTTFSTDDAYACNSAWLTSDNPSTHVCAFSATNSHTSFSPANLVLNTCNTTSVAQSSFFCETLKPACAGRNSPSRARRTEIGIPTSVARAGSSGKEPWKVCRAMMAVVRARGVSGADAGGDDSDCCRRTPKVGAIVRQAGRAACCCCCCC